MKALPYSGAVQTLATNAAASGGASVITLAAVTGNQHVIDWIMWSYGAAPTSGSLTLADGTTTSAIDIIAGGPGFIHFGERGMAFAANAAVTITLADGSQAKKLTVQYR